VARHAGLSAKFDDPAVRARVGGSGHRVARARPMRTAPRGGARLCPYPAMEDCVPAPEVINRATLECLPLAWNKGVEDRIAAAYGPEVTNEVKELYEYAVRRPIGPGRPTTKPRRASPRRSARLIPSSPRRPWRGWQGAFGTCGGGRSRRLTRACRHSRCAIRARMAPVMSTDPPVLAPPSSRRRAPDISGMSLTATNRAN
jgi:hypothetical protein